MVVLIGLQLLLSLLFLFEFLIFYVFGYENIQWELVELLEISEAILTFVTLGISVAMIILLTRRNNHVESRLMAASGEFHQLIREHFDKWQLSSAEAEVALFTIKGMSNTEIAELRGTSEGTIKAQNNAVFRKAGVSNRSQLLGVFVDELVGGSIMPQSEVQAG
jgi:DNA-binding CsgD family transcriptional regulator